MFVTSNAWNFIKSIADSDNEAAVQQLLLERAASSGFRWAFAGYVPSATTKPHDIPSHVLFQEFPEGWAERYNENHYALRDPVVRHVLSANSCM